MSEGLLESLTASSLVSARRQLRLDAIGAAGLPSPRSERWKYTSLRALARRSFEAATPLLDLPGGAELLADIPAPRLVFVQGAFSAQHSNLEGLLPGVSFSTQSLQPDSIRDADAETEAGSDSPPLPDEVFAELGRVLAQCGARLHVETGLDATAQPLHLVQIGTPASSAQAWHLLHAVHIAAGARALLVEHHLDCGEHAHLVNQEVHVAVAEGAQFTHVRVQACSSQTTSLLRTVATVDAGAQYRRLDLETGAALSRHELDIDLVGKGASVRANGLQLARARTHLDTRLQVRHVARDTTCDLAWRGVADGRGRVVLRGGIRIEAGADGSDARLSSRNLLLSDRAEIDAQPVLEIHADEVKAAHGATVGGIDTEALFYLRTRGLPEQEARRILMVSFARQPLALIDDVDVRAKLSARLDAVLGNL